MAIRLAVCWLVLLGSMAIAEKPAWFDPAGKPGSIVLCGPGSAPREVTALFAFERLKKQLQPIVILQGKADRDVAETLTALKKVVKPEDEDEPLPIEIIDARAKPTAKTAGEFAKKLSVAKSLWIIGAKSWLEEKSVRSAVEQHLSRNRWVFAAHGAAAEMGAQKGNLIPELVISEKKRAAETKIDGRVAITLPAGSSVLVRGRLIRLIGRKRVSLELAKSKRRPAKTIELHARDPFADLTALRRAAHNRAANRYPEDDIGKPVVEKGSLMIVGGGGMPRGAFDRFVELAGGKNARIVILPTAVGDPVPRQSRLVDIFQNAGAKEVTLLRARKKTDVEAKESLAVLKRATGIWFGGGRQWRFVDAYAGTKVEPLFHDVLRRGGVIGGSSAGASIQGEYMARGDPLGNREIMAEGYERGLGFLRGVAIDQHFTQRKRLKDLASLVRTYPKFLGIGIDEATAIIVRKSKAEVIGRYAVHFYDNAKQKEGEQPTATVYPGGSFDLAARKVLKEGKKPKPRKRP